MTKKKERELDNKFGPMIDRDLAGYQAAIDAWNPPDIPDTLAGGSSAPKNPPKKQ